MGFWCREDYIQWRHEGIPFNTGYIASKARYTLLKYRDLMLRLHWYYLCTCMPVLFFTCTPTVKPSLLSRHQSPKFLCQQITPGSLNFNCEKILYIRNITFNTLTVTLIKVICSINFSKGFYLLISYVNIWRVHWTEAFKNLEIS